MRKLLALALMDIRLQFTEKSELIFFLVLPIVFTAVLAASISGSMPSDDSRYPLPVVDEDKSDLSAQLVATLQASTVVKAALVSAAEAEQQFSKKDAYIPAILTIPAGFGQKLLEGQATSLRVHRAPNNSNVLTVEQAIAAAVDQVSNTVLAARSSVAEAERIGPFVNAAARQTYMTQAMSMAQAQLQNPAATVQVTQAQQVVRQSTNGAEQSSAGQLVTWVLITLISAAVVFVEERLGGTLRRLVVTPTSKAIILGGKLIGRLGAGLLQMALLIVVGALLFNLNWGRSPLALVVVMVAFGLAGVAFGVLLGTFCKTRSQAGGLTVMFSMLMAALGGAWWPLEITPPLYQTVVKILPTTWAMQGFSDVLVRGADLSGVLPEVGMLLLFSAVFFVVGVKRFRFE